MTACRPDRRPLTGWPGRGATGRRESSTTFASRSRGQDGDGSVCRGCPLRGVGADPSNYVDDASVVTVEVAVMDRLVMSDTIPQEVHALDAVVDIGTDPARITVTPSRRARSSNDSPLRAASSRSGRGRSRAPAKAVGGEGPSIRRTPSTTCSPTCTLTPHPTPRPTSISIGHADHIDRQAVDNGRPRHDIPAIIDLFIGRPWMPPAPQPSTR